MYFCDTPLLVLLKVVGDSKWHTHLRYAMLGPKASLRTPWCYAHHEIMKPWKYDIWCSVQKNRWEQLDVMHTMKSWYYGIRFGVQKQRWEHLDVMHTMKAWNHDIRFSVQQQCWEHLDVVHTMKSSYHTLLCFILVDNPSERSHHFIVYHSCNVHRAYPTCHLRLRITTAIIPFLFRGWHEDFPLVWGVTNKYCSAANYSTKKNAGWKMYRPELAKQQIVNSCTVPNWQNSR